MRHSLESLGPDRFQELVGVLLTVSNPDSQCFPVGHADGGRDVLVRGADRSYHVYQVKFSREPAEIADRAAWLIAAIDGEIQKIERLHKSGRLDRYTLVTNVRGTAVPGKGDMDRVRAHLESAVPVEARVLFRDDLDRRLEAHPHVKWQFPELLVPGDLLEVLASSTVAVSLRRQLQALRAFVVNQFLDDEDVKFKQIELQTKLLTVFVDVPCVPDGFQPARYRPSRGHLQSNRAAQEVWIQAIQRDMELRHREYGDNDSDYLFTDDFAAWLPRIGAASALLDANIQRVVRKAVIEGAPGQGKSTVVQYIAQVHRAKLLGKDDVLQALPESHQKAPMRLPIKVDLRDFALWLAKRNPFSSDPKESVPANWKATLESYLAALINHSSGGIDFSVADLADVASTRPILIILDGLDEVAAISDRESVVAEIDRGVRRLEELALSVQVIVTSRPAAFANSPMMSSSDFQYLYLADLRKEQIEEYARKWTLARRLSGREAAKLIREVDRRIEEPHLRDLARNPMQLAILIGVMNTRGSSLPDRRTELYGSYISLFFDREAEKSPVVRDNRELLIDLHGYIAWVIHTRAEQDAQRGAVEEEELRNLLRDYLHRQGRDDALVDDLFEGMVERVVALVSRVEGTFEFEVQPLREYFVAWYLYDTANYSPPGREVSGTIVDRFDALSRNFYWQNVLRFYAGHYSRGELPSIVESLQRLFEDPIFGRTDHPRIICSSLLSDYVFSQSPVSIKNVVSLMLDGLGVRHVIGPKGARFRSSVNSLSVPWDSGGREITDKALSFMRHRVSSELLRDLCRLVQLNASPEYISDRWLSLEPDVPNAVRRTWAIAGQWLGVISSLPASKAIDLWDRWDSTWGENPYPALLVGVGHEASLAASAELWEAGLRSLLEGKVGSVGSRRVTGDLTALAPFLSSAFVSTGAASARLGIGFRHYWLGGSDARKLVDAMSGSRDIRIAEFGRRLDDGDLVDPSDWAGSLEGWSRFIEAGRGTLGDGFAWERMALAASAVPRKRRSFAEHDALFDADVPLLLRVRAARLRSGAHAWWKEQLASARSADELVLAAALLLSWGTEKCLQEVGSDLVKRLEGLALKDFRRVTACVRLVTGLQTEFGGMSELSDATFDGMATLSPRLCAALAPRWRTESLGGVLGRVDPVGASGAEALLVGLRLRQAVQTGVGWDELCLTLEHHEWEARHEVAPGTYSHLDSESLVAAIPLAVAHRVIDSAELYPDALVGAAEARCRSEATLHVQAVGRVAELDGWFATERGQTVDD